MQGAGFPPGGEQVGRGRRRGAGGGVGGRVVGLMAALQLALDPYMWEWTAITVTEIVGSMANLAAVIFLVEALRPGGRVRSAMLFGVFLGIANVVRFGVEQPHRRT